MSTNAEEIISQANKWTFAGDCSLLEWMKQISENLELKATNTTEALQKLSTNIKRNATALDNASNSLTSMQFTQFVECRCHDDDETIANSADVPLDIANITNEQPKSSNEILKTFLETNLQMLHNCHKKYALDFDADSDEEEAVSNCIYQPKNPYNDRPIPHIYGSKLWKENWHVGLCDGSNDSGDEVSETFSSESLSSVGDESIESTNANLSEWASSTSILNDKYPTTIAVQNASSLRGSQPLFPEDRNIRRAQEIGPIRTNSETSSTQSKTVANNEHDLFSALQNTPTISFSCATEHSQSSSIVSSNSKKVAEPLNDKHVDDDIFADTTTAASNSIDFMPVQPNTSQVKRKPVNLFDDDDFNSFMTEIVDKANQKNAEEPAPIAAVRKSTSTMPTKESQSNVVDLAASPISSIVAPEINSKQNTVNIAIEKSMQIPKSQPLNLFESPDSSPSNKPLFFPKIKPQELDGRTKISSKSLFDDDDEDDDFLNVFGTKKVSLPATLERTKLFSDVVNIDEIVKQNKEVATLFEDDVQESVSLPRTNTIFDTDSSNQINITKSVDNNTTKDLFEKEKPILENKLISAKLMHKSNDDIVDKDESIVVKKPNLFDTDLFSAANDDEEDNLFSKSNATKKTTSITAEKQVQSIAEMQTSFEPSLDITAAHYDERGEILPEIENLPNILVDNQGLSLAYEDKVLGNDKPLYTEATQSLLDSNMTTSCANIRDENSNSSDITERINDNINDTTSKTTNELTVANSEEIRIATNPSTSHNFGGLFLDEPPDDDDFFQTLSSNHLSTPKFSLDLEQDFYEPALPETPTFTQKDSTQTDATNTNTDYGGLCLFSDVPPDDDGVDINVTVVSDSLSETKRLHSIFYDDFTETLEAVKKSNDIKLPANDFIQDEPPSDDDTFNVAIKDTKSFEQSKVEEVKSFQEVLAVTKSVATEPEQPPVLDVTDKAAALTKDQDNSLQVSAEDTKKSVSPISKLQMPKININVQALLPGASPSASNKAQLRKSLENPTTSIVVTEPTNISSSSVSNKTTTLETKESEQSINENILSSICKSRVRIPAKRRPSTRRARQENYQKSLISEDGDDNDNTQSVEGAISESAITKQNANSSDSAIKQAANISIDIATEKTKRDVLFLDSDDDEEFIFKSIKPTNVESTKSIISSTKVVVERSSVENALFANLGKAPNQTTKSVAVSTTLTQQLFANSDDSNDDDDDDLFKHANTKNRNTVSTPVVRPVVSTLPSKIATPTIPTAKLSTTTGNAKSLLFEETSDSDEDLFKNATKSNKATSSIKKPNSNNEIKVAKIIVKDVNSLFGSDNEDDDDFLNALKKPMKVLPKPNLDATTKPLQVVDSKSKGLFSDESDDEDDLFGGGNSRSKLIKANMSKTQQQSSTAQQLKKSDLPSNSTTVDNNPLSDLLNS